MSLWFILNAIFWRGGGSTRPGGWSKLYSYVVTIRRIGVGFRAETWPHASVNRFRAPVDAAGRQRTAADCPSACWWPCSERTEAFRARRWFRSGTPAAPFLAPTPSRILIRSCLRITSVQIGCLGCAQIQRRSPKAAAGLTPGDFPLKSSRNRFIVRRGIGGDLARGLARRSGHPWQPRVGR